MDTYGFNQQEVRQIVRHKPTFLLFEEEYTERKSGIKALQNVLCEELGFSIEVMKTIACKYP